MDEGCYFRINGYWKKLNDKVRKKNNVLYKNTYLIFEALNFNLLVVRICMSYLILRLMIDDDDCLEMHIRLEFSTTLVLKVLRLGFISLPPSIPIVSVIDSKCCLHEINRLPPPVYETNSCLLIQTLQKEVYFHVKDTHRTRDFRITGDIGQSSFTNRCSARLCVRSFWLISDRTTKKNFPSHFTRLRQANIKGNSFGSLSINK